MPNEKTTGALSGAASGASIGTAVMPGIGTAIGAVIGGAIGFFGSKKSKKPTAAPFTPVSVQEEQRRALTGNLANFDLASSLAERTNSFNQSEANRLIERAIPGFSAAQRGLMAKVTEDLNSENDLPQDTRDKIAQLAAEKGVSRGTSGNFNSFNLVKDFGFNLLDWKQAARARAMNTLSTVYGLTPKVNVMSPMASMVDPNTAISVAGNNNQMQYNRDQSLLNAETQYENDRIAAQNGALSAAMSSFAGMYGGKSAPSTQAKVNAPPSSIARNPNARYATTLPRWGS